MAASSTHLGDIEERYFTCPICFDSLKEPKTLRCLHRYCKRCLQGVIAGERDKFKCPICQEEYDIPPDGVEGFRTDFHIKSVVEFLQLGKTYKQDNVKKCYGCKQTKKVTSYCFKCKDFLCQECYQFHLNNDMVAEHRPHVLDLNTVDVRRLTLKKLVSLTEDPRCTVHVKHLAQLCCETCGNLPICVACTYGDHEAHKIHDVKKLARSEREKLQAEITELEKCKEILYALPGRVENVRGRLEAKVKEQLEKARTQHKKALGRVSKKTESSKKRLGQKRKGILARREEECNMVKSELKEERKKLTARYNKILEEKQQTHDKEIRQVDGETNIMDAKFEEKKEKLNRELQHFEERVRARQLSHEQQIMGVSNHSKHNISKYENFTAIATTVLASNDEWTEVQCLPAIRAAGKPLVKDAKEEYGELESLSDTKMKDLSLLFMVSGTLTEREESVIEITGIEDKSREVWAIASMDDGDIIVTGTAQKKSHITVINREGRIKQQDLIEKAAGSSWTPFLHCHSLSHSLIATACESNQVGIYDVSNGTYVKKEIDWPGFATWVTTDTQNNIYVGGDEGDVLVFDNRLNYTSKMKLPVCIKHACDAVLHRGILLVCDMNGNKALAVTMERGEARVVYQFTKPDGGDSPLSVCTDSCQYIYMLWTGSGQSILTQYSQDGRQILTTRRVDKDAWCITTMGTEEGDKLLVATRNSGKVYTYGLTE